MYKNRNVVAQLVRRAERAGFKAIALTVDTPRLGRREADIKNRCESTNVILRFAKWLRFVSFTCVFISRFVLPPYLTLKNFEGLDLGKMDQVSSTHSDINVFEVFRRCLLWTISNNLVSLQANDSGLASYVAGQIDRSLSWKVTPSLGSETLCLGCKNFILWILCWTQTGREVASDHHQPTHPSKGCHYCWRWLA